MKHIRFSTRTMLITITLIAIGIATTLYIRSYLRERYVVTIVDAVTGKPISDVTYRYSWRAATSVFEEGEWADSHSSTGKLVLRIPPSCLLSLSIYSENHHTLTVPLAVEKAVPRRHTIQLEPARIWTGTVVNEQGEPIANARVAPVTKDSPLGTIDEQRSVRTGQDGRFRIIEGDLMHVLHGSYTPTHFGPVLVNDSNVVLPKTQDIHGVVIDERGKHLSGVMIMSMFKQTKTDAHGRFRLISPVSRLSGVPLKFEHPECLGRTSTVAVDEATEPINIKLLRKKRLTGTVLDASGNSLKDFKIAVGFGQVPLPSKFIQQSVADGRFNVFLNKSGIYQVVIRSDQMVRRTAVVVDQLETKVDIELPPGVDVSGRLQLPTYAKNVRVSLEPLPTEQERHTIADTLINSWNPSGIITHATQTVLASGGHYRFRNIAAGNYRMRISGDNVAPAIRVVQVGNADVQVATLSLKATGTLTGLITNNQRPVRFGSAVLKRGQRITRRFMTNEDGTFRLSQVPPGLVDIEFNEDPNKQFGQVFRRTARVVSGQVTRVRLKNDWLPNNSTTSNLNVVVRHNEWLPGHPRRSIGLAAIPESGQAIVAPVTDGWLTFLKPQPVNVPNVVDGRYSLRVFDSLMLPGRELARRSVHVAPNMPHVQFQLGAGTIRGVVRNADIRGEHAYAVRVDAQGVVVGKPLTTVVDDNRFVFLFVRAGTYVVRVYDPKNGWADLGRITVDQDPVTMQMDSLEKGVTVKCWVDFRTINRMPDNALVTSGDGVIQFSVPCTFDRFQLSNLPPGQWTIELQADGQAIRSRVVTVGQEDQTLTL